MALWTLFGLVSGKATTSWPAAGGDDGQDGLFGMPRYNPEACREGCHQCAEVCPTHAIEASGDELSVDYGRCVVCQLCTEACPTGAMEPSNDWAFGVRSRADLLWAKIPPQSIAATGTDKRTFRRSLHVRHVDAGSCNGCESELQALNNPFYNLHRLGIFFTPSPRFADLLLVTGPVTRAMLEPLRTAYDAMPEPRWVMAGGNLRRLWRNSRGKLCLRDWPRGRASCRPLPPRLSAQPCRDHRRPVDVPRPRAATRERGAHRWLIRSSSYPFCCGSPQRLSRLFGRWAPFGRTLLTAGALSGVIAAIVGLLDPTKTIVLPVHLAGEAVAFRMSPEALWLFGFGLAPAVFACALGSPSERGRSGWLFGAAVSLAGALGVCGLQNGAALLVAWEAMSLGGAIMILSERLETSRGRTILFMLALLEIGAVALVLAVAILGVGASSLEFARFAGGAAALTPPMAIGVGILILVGFGAKLGLLPFYEWFPGAYGSGSGASGAILSGAVLNAAFFGLSRGLTEWLPPAADGAFPSLAVVVVAIGTISAILTILYAFQEDDWRRLLSFSTAENASIAVAALGAAMLFRSYQLLDLAGLAWTVALLHLAGHALAKGTLFLTADGLRRATGITPSRRAARADTGCSGLARSLER